ADEALFAREIRSAGGVTGPLALVFHRVAVEHVLGHARDLLGHGCPDMAPKPPTARDAPALAVAPLDYRGGGGGGAAGGVLTPGGGGGGAPGGGGGTAGGAGRGQR